MDAASMFIRVPLYKAFTEYTPVIPKLYWDVYSQEERIKAICNELDKICAYANTLGIQLNYNTAEIEALYNEFEEFKASGFDDYYREIIETWVERHMPDIIRQAVKMVFFGLTDTGYFCAYIPDSWSDIIFDTGQIYGSLAYGRLILQMDVDGTGVLPNGTPTVDEMVIEQVHKYEEAILDGTY